MRYIAKAKTLDPLDINTARIAFEAGLAPHDYVSELRPPVKNMNAHTDKGGCSCFGSVVG